MKSSRLGFTLVELIIVVAIIAIIAAAVFVAIDPARRFNAARNSTRWTHITSVMEAIKKFQVDNNGSLPSTAVAIDNATSTYQLIGEDVGTCATATCATIAGSIAASNCSVDSLDTDLAPYLQEIPFDPSTGDADDTRYFINKNANGILEIGACDPQGEEGGGGGTPPTIRLTR